MSDNYTDLMRNTALARLCLALNSTGATPELIDGLKPFMDDADFSMLAITNIVRMLRATPNATFADTQTQLSYIATELGITVSVPGILRAMSFIELANTSADIDTLISKYKLAAEIDFDGDWRKITLEITRTMLATLVARGMLADDRELTQKLMATLDQFDAEEIEKLARVDVGFLWGNANAS